jgi:hypothetical protein
VAPHQKLQRNLELFWFKSSMPLSTESLLKLFLPDFILENFEFKGVIVSEDTFHIQAHVAMTEQHKQQIEAVTEKNKPQDSQQTQWGKRPDGTGKT